MLSGRNLVLVVVVHEGQKARLDNVRGTTLQPFPELKRLGELLPVKPVLSAREQPARVVAHGDAWKLGRSTHI